MKKNFGIRLEASQLEAFGKVAAGYHMEPTTYASTIISRFADLKPEFALDALASIPKEFFKGKPGRPSAVASLEQKA